LQECALIFAKVAEPQPTMHEAVLASKAEFAPKGDGPIARGGVLRQTRDSSRRQTDEIVQRETWPESC
jgi:hypothetical protein